jgi:GT2 family glycosyltransferase
MRDSAFVVRLDGDDRIGPGYLEAANSVLSTGADVANPDAILFGDQVSRWPVPARVTMPVLLRKNLVHCAAAFRRSYWSDVGGFDETLPMWIDYDFWIRLAEHGARIHKVPGDHFFYRRHSGSLSRRNSDSSEIRQRLRAKHSSLYPAHGL